MTRRGALAGIMAATVRSSQANSAVALGIIGIGRRSRLVGTMFGRDSRARIAALQDLYNDQIDLPKTEIPGAASARIYTDYRDLLADGCAPSRNRRS